MKVNMHVHEARYCRGSLRVEDGQIGGRDVLRNVNDAALHHDDGQTTASRCPRPVNEASVADDQICSLRDQVSSLSMPPNACWPVNSAAWTGDAGTSGALSGNALGTRAPIQRVTAPIPPIPRYVQESPNFRPRNGPGKLPNDLFSGYA